MTLQGSLKHVQLPDVVQLVSTAGKSGMFEIRKGSLVGHIYLRDGQIVHADCGELLGEEAVYEMAVWQEGEFVFHPNIDAPTTSVEKSNTNLFMEAARRIDEWRVLSRKIPSIDMIPEIIPSLPRGRSHVQLNTGEWIVLAKINGHRSIREIARICNISAFDTAKILYGLITHHLVRLKAPEDMPAESLETQELRAEDLEAVLGNNPGDLSPDALLSYLERVREVSLEILGQVGRDVIERHYEEARSAIQAGQGYTVVQDAVSQIARAANILKGPSASEMLLRQLKSIKIETG